MLKKSGFAMDHNDLSEIQGGSASERYHLTSAELTELQAIDSTYLKLAGGTMSGAIDMGTNQINNVVDPTAAQDAATKKYTDDEILTTWLKTVDQTGLTGDKTGSFNLETTGTAILGGLTVNGDTVLNGATRIIPNTSNIYLDVVEYSLNSFKFPTLLPTAGFGTRVLGFEGGPYYLQEVGTSTGFVLFNRGGSKRWSYIYTSATGRFELTTSETDPTFYWTDIDLSFTDDYGTVFGTGKDVKFSYDGTDMLIKCDVVAASDLKVECGTERTLELQTTVYDDLRTPANSIKLLGSIGVPSYAQFADDGAGSTGVYTYMFEPTDLNQVFFTIQMPHTYKEGTDLLPHVHWSPQSTNTGNCEWKLEYTIANIGDTFGDTATLSMLDAADGTINKHQVTTGATIDGSGMDISHMLVCRLYRDGGEGDDTFTGDAAFLEFDVHFEINTMGSRRELFKQGA